MSRAVVGQLIVFLLLNGNGLISTQETGQDRMWPLRCIVDRQAMIESCRSWVLGKWNVSLTLLSVIRIGNADDYDRRLCCSMFDEIACYNSHNLPEDCQAIREEVAEAVRNRHEFVDCESRFNRQSCDDSNVDGEPSAPVLDPEQEPPIVESQDQSQYHLISEGLDHKVVHVHDQEQNQSPDQSDVLSTLDVAEPAQPIQQRPANSGVCRQELIDSMNQCYEKKQLSWSGSDDKLQKACCLLYETGTCLYQSPASEFLEGECVPYLYKLLLNRTLVNHVTCQLLAPLSSCHLDSAQTELLNKMILPTIKTIFNGTDDRTMQVLDERNANRSIETKANQTEPISGNTTTVKQKPSEKFEIKEIDFDRQNDTLIDTTKTDSKEAHQHHHCHHHHYPSPNTKTMSTSAHQSLDSKHKKFRKIETLKVSGGNTTKQLSTNQTSANKNGTRKAKLYTGGDSEREDYQTIIMISVFAFIMVGACLMPCILFTLMGCGKKRRRKQAIEIQGPFQMPENQSQSRASTATTVAIDDVNGHSNGLTDSGVGEDQETSFTLKTDEDGKAKVKEGEVTERNLDEFKRKKDDEDDDLKRDVEI